MLIGSSVGSRRRMYILEYVRCELRVERSDMPTSAACPTVRRGSSALRVTKYTLSLVPCTFYAVPTTNPMQALIFAAGLGTRLRPLTNDRPKALVTVGGRPLLGIVLRRLARQGFERAVVNVHHFADQVIAYIQEQDFGLEVLVSDERELLLDTGGGLRHAQPLLGESPFLIHNVDILTDLDYADLRAACAESGNTVAALAIRQRDTSRYLLFDDQLRLAGWRNAKSGEQIVKRKTNRLSDWAYSGIGWFEPDIFHYLPPAGEVASLIPALLAAAADGRVIGRPHDQDYWLDVGKPAALRRAEEWLPGEV